MSESRSSVAGSDVDAEIAKVIEGRRQWCLVRRDALSQFLDDGRSEIDNGFAERAIRTLAIGRNCLFAGADAAAQRSAILYSLMASWDLAKVDIGAYLSDVMMRIAYGWPQARLSELVPAKWAEPRAPAMQAAA